MTVTLPLRLVSEANVREHWARKAKRARTQRGLVMLRLRSECTWWALGSGTAVTLTRIAPRELDGDNLQRAFKATRDGVAYYFGCKDNDPRIEWRYAQERGKPKEYAVRVTIEAKEVQG